MAGAFCAARRTGGSVGGVQSIHAEADEVPAARDGHPGRWSADSSSFNLDITRFVPVKFSLFSCNDSFLCSIASSVEV